MISIFFYCCCYPTLSHHSHHNATSSPDRSPLTFDNQSTSERALSLYEEAEQHGNQAAKRALKYLRNAIAKQCPLLGEL